MFSTININLSLKIQVYSFRKKGVGFVHCDIVFPLYYFTTGHVVSMMWYKMILIFLKAQPDRISFAPKTGSHSNKSAVHGKIQKKSRFTSVLFFTTKIVSNHEHYFALVAWVCKVSFQHYSLLCIVLHSYCRTTTLSVAEATFSFFTRTYDTTISLLRKEESYRWISWVKNKIFCSTF